MLACNSQLAMPASVKMCVGSLLCFEWKLSPRGICILRLGPQLVLYGTMRRWHLAGGSILLGWVLRVCYTGPIFCFSLCLLCAMEWDRCASWMAGQPHAPTATPALTWMDWIPFELWAKTNLLFPKSYFLSGCFKTTEMWPIQSRLWRDSHLWEGQRFLLFSKVDILTEMLDTNLFFSTKLQYFSYDTLRKHNGLFHSCLLKNICHSENCGDYATSPKRR